VKEDQSDTIKKALEKASGTTGKKFRRGFYKVNSQRHNNRAIGRQAWSECEREHGKRKKNHEKKQPHKSGKTKKKKKKKKGKGNKKQKGLKIEEG